MLVFTFRYLRCLRKISTKMDLAEILIDGKKIIDLMPHKTPMLMISRLLRLDATSVETNFEINESNVLVDNSYLSEAGIIENIAQTATLTVGYDYYVSVKNKKENYIPPFGYIGAINRLIIEQLPPVGATINTKSVVNLKLADITFVKSEIWLDGKLIAEAETKVFIESRKSK